jgi:hypothetical protein
MSAADNADWNNYELRINLVEIAWQLGKMGFIGGDYDGCPRELVEEWSVEFEDVWRDAGNNPDKDSPYCMYDEKTDTVYRMDFMTFMETFVQAKVVEWKVSA